ncbi:MAG: alpha/beta fold hydrolase [Hyphomicrobiales bacterium]
MQTHIVFDFMGFVVLNKSSFEDVIPIESFIIESSEMKLFYRTFGADHHQPIIILHGLLGISDNWVTFARRIASYGFKVYLPDQRNHGQSPHSDTFNYLVMVDDLKEFMNSHNIEQPIIIGHSMGGKVAMRFALENQELLKKLVIVDISLRTYPPRFQHKAMIEAMRSIDLPTITSRKEIEDKLTEKLKSKKLVWFLMKNIHRIGKNQFQWRAYLDGILNNLDIMFDGVDTPLRFVKPTLFIKGGNSDYIQYKDYDQIRYNFPMAEIIAIADTSHWVQAEAPERFFQLVSGFVDEDATPDHT